MTTEIGFRVADRYVLDELIGHGGMAEVYRATDSQLGRPVAVKLLRGEAAGTTERERFAAEARTVARLSHPSVVTLLDAGLTGDQPFLVMELVDGTTLNVRLAEGAMPPAEVARLGHDLADALAYAHAQGIVHRDVKPGNVLLDGQGRAFLADFGIARVLDGATRHTAAGQAIGSPAYLAPEQVGGGELTGAADVYSLGLMLLEALTGNRAYTGTATEMVYARLQAPPDVPDDLDESWRALLCSMTALDPTARPTAAQVAAALAGPDPDQTAPFDVGSMTQLLPTPATTALAGAAGAGAHPRRTLRAAIAAAIAAVALVGTWLVVGASGDDPPTIPPVPAGVRGDLRAPLGDLHDAIHGSTP